MTVPRCGVHPADLTGAVFGRLRVVARAGSAGKGTTWRCVCACGAERVAQRSNLVGGNTRSCGCLAREESARRGRASARPPVPCKVDGCSDTTQKGGRGYCGKHAQRVRRYGSPDAVQPERIRRVNNRFAQLAGVDSVKPSTYRKSFGRHEHRRVMEEHVGRPLRSDEIVHHIDGDRHNNAIENLQIVTREEHARLHSDDMQYQARMRRQGARA